MFKTFKLAIFLTLIVGAVPLLAKSNFSYSENDSIKKNEQKLEELLQMNCHDFGLNNLEDNTKLDVLKTIETYPEEILFKYYSEHANNICYYHFSNLTKMLLPNFKSQITTAYISSLQDCIKKKTNAKYCLGHHEYFFIDSAAILGQICTQESFDLFKEINCQYKEFKYQTCQALKYKTYRECPEYNNHLVEIQSLHSGYTHQCTKFKWRKPSCLKNI